MKRRWKQIGSLFLAVCMVITMLPMTAFAGGPVSGSLYIDGNYDSISLDGDAGDLALKGWAWDTETATLTLTEDYDGAPIEIIPSGDDDVITLVYIGDVTITSTGVDNGLICDGNLIIDGSGGTLSVGSSYRAINVMKDLTIEENASVAASCSGSYAILCQGDLDLRGSLTATCTASSNPIAIDIDSPSVLVTSGNLTTNCKVDADMTVNDGTVDITGDITGKLTVSAGQVTVTGQVGDGILNTGGTVRVNGEQIFAPALFLNASETGANPFHLGTESGPSADLSGYTWDGTTKILTLSGFTYTSSGEAAMKIVGAVGADVEIVLADDSVNSIICANTTDDPTYGINSGNTITFSGEGSLTATGGTSINSYGIYTESGDIIIKGGTLTATGGEANGASHAKSYGIYAYGDITVEEGDITATGGTSTEESCGIYALENISVKGGAITADGGTSTNSYGMYAYKDITVEEGTLTATGGEANDTSANTSNGIYAYRGITVSGGAITATGGTSDNESYGIRAWDWPIRIKGGTVTASGGISDDYSYGIYADVGAREGIIIEGGTLTATGGTSAQSSYGASATGNLLFKSGCLVLQGEKRAFYWNTEALTVDAPAYTWWAGADNTALDNEGQTTAFVDGQGGNYYKFIKLTTLDTLAAANFTFAAPGLIYDGSDHKATVTAAITASASVIEAGTISYSFSKYGVAVSQVKDAGNYKIFASNTGGNKYEAAANIEIAGFTIDKKSITPTIEVSGSYTYDNGNAITPDYTVKDGSDELAESDYTGVISDNINPGTATITVNEKLGGNYTFSQTTGTFEIGKGDMVPLTITGGDRAMTYGETLVLAIEGGSGTGAVTYEVTNGTGTASVEGNVLTAIQLGTVQVTATKAEDAAYNAATSDPVTITITKGTPTGTPAYTAITTSGKTLADAALNKGSIPLLGTIAWDLDPATPVTANTSYAWTFSPEDGTNYNNLTGVITVWIKSSGSGGSGGGGSATPAAPVTSIPVKDLIAGNKSDVTVKSDAGTLTLPSHMLSNLDVAKDAKAEVKMVTVNPNNLAAEAQALVGGRPIVAINLVIDGKVTGWNNPDAPVTVSIPYMPTAEELRNPGGITAFYIDSQGNLIEMTGAKYDPVTKSVVFQTTHFSYYAVGYKTEIAEIQFGDVKHGAWYYDAVRFCVEKGITSGTSETTFSPKGTLTRGQFITMLLKAYDIDPVSNATDNFIDAGSTYYTGYLAAAKAKGIASGLGGNRFAPEQAITRQEMFTMLYNALKSLNKLPAADNGKTLADFTDSGKVASWAADSMNALVKSGTVSGSGSKLDPRGGSTRAQMAQVLYNLLEK